MDIFDRKILAIMQNDNRITSEELGDTIGLSATACQRRLKKLRQSGTIQKEVAILNSAMFDSYITVIVEVTFKQVAGKIIEYFKAQMAKQKEIQQCYSTAGSIDFFVIFTVSTMLEFEILSHRLLLNNSSIENFRSTVVMENVKTGLNIPF